jgi:hypothetical protein
MNGATGSDRIINTSMVQFSSYNENNPNVGQIYGTNPVFYYVSFATSGRHSFISYDDGLQYNPLDMTITNTRIRGDLNVTGATGSSGNITSSGTISGATITSSGNITSSGTISGETITSSGNITASGAMSGATITALGTISGETITSSGNITASGEISGETITSSGNIRSSGEISGATITSSGTISGATITSSGNITASGTISGATITSSGNITSSETISATSFTSTSDYRLKQEIRSFGLEEYCVDDLNPVYFKFKQNGKESLGVIAHELQEYYPFLVEGNKDGPNTQSVNYNGLIAVLIKEIQELKKDVKELKNK